MGPQAARVKVLVVEDEPHIARTLVLILEQNGYEARAATTVAEAVEGARRLRPDIIVSDLILPDGSGLDAALGIKREFPNLRVLLLTGQSVPTDALERARREGHQFAFLTKPVPPQELLRALQKLR